MEELNIEIARLSQRLSKIEKKLGLDKAQKEKPNENAKEATK